MRLLAGYPSAAITEMIVQAVAMRNIFQLLAGTEPEVDPLHDQIDELTEVADIFCAPRLVWASDTLAG